MQRFRMTVMLAAAALLSVLLTILAFCPAAWLAPLLKKQTQGRIRLGDAQGSLCHGSAFVGATPSGREAVTALLPGRFSWHLSPLLLVGRADASLSNAQVLSQPVTVRGNWSAWSISAASLALPAERLVRG